MYQTPEHLIALNKANLEATVRFAEIALQGTGRMLEVQLKAAKSAFANGVMHAKALAEVKNVEQLAQLKNALAQPNLQKMNVYIKSVYDVAATTQLEIGKLLEEQIIEFNKHYFTAIDTMVKSAPAGSEIAAAAVKSAIAEVNSAHDNLSKSAQQFAEVTQANVEAATGPAANPSKRKAT